MVTVTFKCVHLTKIKRINKQDANKKKKGRKEEKQKLLA